MPFDVIERVLGFNRGGFGIVDGGVICFIHLRGSNSPDVAIISLDESGITARAVWAGETQFVGDEFTVPVIVDGEVVAVLNVKSGGQEAYDDSDRLLMEILAFHVASALVSLEQRRELGERESQLRVESEMLMMMNEKFHVVGRLAKHGVRNNLSIMMNKLYIAREAAESGEVVGLLDDVESICGRIVDIFDSAADYERLGSEELKPVNVGEAYRTALSMFDLEGIRVVNCCGALMIRADSLLSRVFYNLIDNSLEHGGWVGEIVLDKWEDGGLLRIIYSDDGAGIPLEVRGSLFETNGNLRVHGLNLIRRIVETYGGGITEEGAGDGARFVISLPGIDERICPTPTRS